MNRKTGLRIIIAETSPVIAAGIEAVVRRIDSIEAQAFCVATNKDLINSIKSLSPHIVIVNPTFGGTFNPMDLRDAASGTAFRLVAIEITPLNKAARALYDATLPITDDLPSLSKRFSDLISSPGSDTEETREALSQREKEIVIEVVKGLTNKEIADKLFLSVHTVITHRRNIARKLEIHSATGLTIYAIVNHLVDLSEIKV